MKINFNISPTLPSTESHLKKSLSSGKLSGDGIYTKKCKEWIEAQTNVPYALLTTSGTHALEMAAWLCEIMPGDEVIMPSYTFTSAANAFVALGARIIFVDIRPDTMNIDECLIEQAVTSKTKAIVPMHYAGVGCEMDSINSIAKVSDLRVVEDAAQGICASYNGKALGTLSDFGCFSFHETKNFSMGEGGCLLLHNEGDNEKAEIMREKGTNRSKFFRGQIDKYSWQGWGSSYLPSDLNAAYLWSQFECAEEINRNRMSTWYAYHQAFLSLRDNGQIELPVIPEHCTHNAHMYWLKVRDLEEREKLLFYLHENGIHAVYHYVPLHSTKAGLRFGSFRGNDRYTTKESERLIRLPLYYGIEKEKIEYIIEKVTSFFINNR